MKKLAVLLAVVMFGLGESLIAQTSPDIAGAWQATVQGSGGMRMILKVEHDDKVAGGLLGTLYPLNHDFGSQGRTATAISLQGQVFKFAVAPIEISFEGRMSPNGAAIVGTWTQGKVTHEQTFDRATPETAWAMPAPDKGMPKDADPEFEVATIKPSDPANRNDGFHLRGRHLFIENQTVNKLIAFAYGIHTRQIIDGPGWFATDHFDIDGVPDVVGQPSLIQMEGMVRKLLTDRFQFTFHHDKRELSVYAVTVGKTELKIRKSLGDPDGLPDQNGGQNGGIRTDRFTNVSMDEFALILQFIQDRPVINETGLAGRYDFTLKYALNDQQVDDPNAPPGLFTAIQEQAGLKLEAKKAPADVYVVDHVEKPSSN